MMKLYMRSKMKKAWLVAISLALVVALLGIAGCISRKGTVPAETGKAPTLAKTIISTSQPIGISVTGRGKVTVVPDVAILRVGVEAQAKTVAEARDQAAEAMNKVVEALKANGVAEKDIKTYHFSIYPVRKWERGKEEEEEVLIGFRVNNLVSAKIREIDKAGVIVDAVVEAGGDLIRVEGISFTIEDPTPYHAEAQEKAVADAKAKAEQLASSAGVTLGKPIYISEGYISRPVYEVKRLPIPAPAVIPPPPPTLISPGEQEITVSVSITFSIE
jgi:hypothetical protein